MGNNITIHLHFSIVCSLEEKGKKGRVASAGFTDSDISWWHFLVLYQLKHPNITCQSIFSDCYLLYHKIVSQLFSLYCLKDHILVHLALNGRISCCCCFIFCSMLLLQACTCSSLNSHVLASLAETCFLPLFHLCLAIGRFMQHELSLSFSLTHMKHAAAAKSRISWDPL